MAEHSWFLCGLCGVSVKCGKCGNNCCNGGYGWVDGIECDACPSAYEMQDQSRDIPPALLTAAALKAAQEALNVWTATYADDMVGEEALAEARSKITGGTLGYIAQIQAQVAEAIAASPYA